MEPTKSGSTSQGKPLKEAKQEFIAERDGNYAANLEYVLEKWLTWCERRDVRTLEDVSSRTMRNYATRLKQREQADAISAPTARTYYNYISALLNWGVEVGYLAENSAEKRHAKKPLPDRTTNSGDQQFWKPKQRRAIVSFVDDRARSAIDEKGADAFEEVRDRALITVLAYTGVRGSEVLADSRDDRRNGLRWQSVDLENGVITVLGKSQNREETALPGQAVDPLQRLEGLLDPPVDEWPVFPSRHPPSLYDRIRAAGYDVPDADPWGFVLKEGIEPPSMSTSGARTLLKRLSEAAGVPGLNFEAGEYLTLHGARRGVGETLYRERGAAAAQRTLRHADPATTSQMYSHIEASELADENTEVFESDGY